MKTKIINIWKKQKNKKIIFSVGILVICIGLALILGTCFFKDNQKLEEKSKNSSNEKTIVIKNNLKPTEKDTKEKLGTLKVGDINLDKEFYAYIDNQRICSSGAICVADWNEDILKKDKNITIGSYALGSKKLSKSISKIKKGSKAYLEYKGTTYEYKYAKKRTIKNPNTNMRFNTSKGKKEYLSLFARKTPMTYDVLDFEYVDKK